MSASGIGKRSSSSADEDAELDAALFDMVVMGDALGRLSLGTVVLQHNTSIKISARCVNAMIDRCLELFGFF